jgi:putative FmdB family regulatory protein
MPLYEYECSQHKIIEIQQSINDPELSECPLCRKESNVHTCVKKLISLSSFHLMGDGWAKDSYK